jgi:hypothetical protein
MTVLKLLEVDCKQEHLGGTWYTAGRNRLDLETARKLVYTHSSLK